MKRWLYALLALALLVLLGWAGYEAYASYRDLAARVALLEAKVQAQEEALKGLADRLSRVEGEVFKAPSPPLSLPEVPAPQGAPSWPYVVGLLVVLALLYLVFRLLRQGSRKPEKTGEAPSQGLEEARMEEEGGPPRS